jgi:hypothetical protein
VSYAIPAVKSRVVQFAAGSFGLTVLAVLLAASWLRPFVPAPRAERIRDVNWLRGR